MDPVSVLTLVSAIVYPLAKASRVSSRSKDRKAILQDVERDVAAVQDLVQLTERHHQGKILEDFPSLKDFCGAYLELRILCSVDPESPLQRLKLELKWRKFERLVKTMKKSKSNFEVAVNLDQQRITNRTLQTLQTQMQTQLRDIQTSVNNNNSRTRRPQHFGGNRYAKQRGKATRGNNESQGKRESLRAVEISPRYPEGMIRGLEPPGMLNEKKSADGLFSPFLLRSQETPDTSLPVEAVKAIIETGNPCETVTDSKLIGLSDANTGHIGKFTQQGKAPISSCAPDIISNAMDFPAKVLNEVSSITPISFSKGAEIIAGVVGGGGLVVTGLNAGVGYANHLVSKEAAAAAQIAAEAAKSSAETAKQKLAFEMEEAAKTKGDSHGNDDSSDDVSMTGPSRGTRKKANGRRASPVRSSKSLGSIRYSRSRQTSKSTSQQRENQQILEGIEKMLKTIQHQKQPSIAAVPGNSGNIQALEAERTELAKLDSTLRKLRAQAEQSGQRDGAIRIQTKTKTSSLQDNALAGQARKTVKEDAEAFNFVEEEQPRNVAREDDISPTQTISEMNSFPIGSVPNDEGYGSNQEHTLASTDYEPKANSESDLSPDEAEEARTEGVVKFQDEHDAISISPIVDPGAKISLKYEHDQAIDEPGHTNTAVISTSQADILIEAKVNTADVALSLGAPDGFDDFPSGSVSSENANDAFSHDLGRVNIEMTVLPCLPEQREIRPSAEPTTGSQTN